MFYKKIADIAFKQDRERFFKEADKYEMIPYLVNSLSESEKQELAEAKETWRNMTDLPDYPDIDFPLAIPSFIKVKTFSTHKNFYKKNKRRQRKRRCQTLIFLVSLFL